ncbi:acyl-CoA carboxylase subunit beta [Alkalicoccobacillus murimartini]|uniref:Propionyl-CoA carboxylase beta chain n=1 Tax=Alkalicoccobacillus murimartini TaxID=171685 RepID=A0ABT9YJP1_9BACI|nr:acyl-CoA carboxylase subunit beta [Alkalicoccobacillus murimartini]MDQ0207956.1 propionyl-CoA carboxylase beta chain [Alkalicoccobacillus murimartini]
MNRNQAMDTYLEKLQSIFNEENAKRTKQHSKGKRTAQERLDDLLDSGSWTEFQQFAAGNQDEIEQLNDGVLIGVGTIHGTKVCVFAQDFTVAGGSLGEIHAKKIAWLMDLAADMKAPIIGLNDSGGARIQEGITALEGYGSIFQRNANYSGVIPQISVILGPCAGGAVYSPALTDFIFMVEKTSQMFITGPKVVKVITGTDIAGEDLGGASMHASISGNVHVIAKTETDILQEVRRLICLWKPVKTEEVLAPKGTSLLTLLPTDSRKGYDIKTIIHSLVDQDSFFEVQKKFARNMVIGFARLNGKPIGIISNNPKVMAGCIDMDAADKCARFVRFCDAFNYPLLVLEDVSGFMPGIKQEQGGLIRHGAKIIYAFATATVPRITVILRKAYGGAFVALNSKAIGADFVFAWPGSEVSVMGPEGAASIIYAKEIQKSPNPDQMKQEKISEYRSLYADSYHAANKALIDDIIHPDDTRKRLILAFSLVEKKQRNHPHRKHGNIPL